LFDIKYESSVNYVIVKRYSKIFENSFLKNGIIEFRSEVFIRVAPKLMQFRFLFKIQMMVAKSLIIDKF